MLDNLELYLAASCLKSKKYSAATELYLKVNARNESAEAWLGISFCKLYQLAEGLKIDEVIECFKKAKLIDPTLRSIIEDAFIKRCQIVKIAYVNFYNEALKQQIKENKKVSATLLLTGSHLPEQNRDNKEFSSFIELGNHGEGVANFDLKAGLDKFLEEILLKLNEIDTALKMNVDQASKAYNAYFQMEITVIKIG
jgi:tetratricopeptide (TPR) repeat protein